MLLESHCTCFLGRPPCGWCLALTEEAISWLTLTKEEEAIYYHLRRVYVVHRFVLGFGDRLVPCCPDISPCKATHAAYPPTRLCCFERPDCDYSHDPDILAEIRRARYASGNLPPELPQIWYD